MPIINPSKTSSRKFTLVYNLYLDSVLNHYIPEAYIAEILPNGEIGIMKAKALTDDVIKSYGLDPLEDNCKMVLFYSGQLKVSVLEKKFCTKKRNQNTLEKILDTPALKRVLISFIERTMNSFFDEVVNRELPLVMNMKRVTRLQELLLHPIIEPLKPHLRFDKTSEGINYYLTLLDGKFKNLSLFLQNITLLTNEFAWMIFDNHLFRIEHINGNKLKPFLKKEHLFIPHKLAVDYFRKFVLEVAKMVDIEANGFKVVHNTTILQKKVSTSYDFVHEEMVLDVIFDYGDISYSLGSPSKKRTKLYISEEQEISILQTIRNEEQEERTVGQLLSLGLELTRSKRFRLIKKDDHLGMVSFLQTHRVAINEMGVIVELPEFQGKRIVLKSHSIDVFTEGKEDWFDVKAVIKVGEFMIVFSELLSHIRDENRFYKLPDDHFFLIPISWMNRYENMARFVEERDGELFIKKSQYGIVEDVIVMQDYVLTEEEVEYIPSPNLNATLRPYQYDGVKWLLKHQKNHLGACLADDMGLGKTLQTLAVLSDMKDGLESILVPMEGQLDLFSSFKDEKKQKPLKALIIMPSSLIFNWYNEIQKFTPYLTVVIQIGANRYQDHRQLSKFDIVLTTYHTVLRDTELLQKVEWGYIVLDESQMIKNKDSKMFKAINALDADHRISLSGTPIENSLSDLWSQMQFINHGILGDFKFFKEEYLIPIEKEGDEDALKNLIQIVQPFILRRTKDEVAKDLPPLTEKVEVVEMAKAQKDIYDKEKSAVRNLILGVDDFDSLSKLHVLSALMKLRQMANSPRMVLDLYNQGSEKMNHVLAQMETIAKAGHKVLLFSTFTKLLDLYMEECESRCWKYVKLTGKSSQKQRKQSVSDFQSQGDIPFFFISLKAGGTGLNLTAADYVFVLDPWWNPFAEKQAIARAHRIGQDKPVTVIRFISKDTIEEKILTLQEKKTALSDSILKVGQEKMNLQKSDIEFILG